MFRLRCNGASSSAATSPHLPHQGSSSRLCARAMWEAALCAFVPRIASHSLGQSRGGAPSDAELEHVFFFRSSNAFSREHFLGALLFTSLHFSYTSLDPQTKDDSPAPHTIDRKPATATTTKTFSSWRSDCKMLAERTASRNVLILFYFISRGEALARTR